MELNIEAGDTAKYDLILHVYEDEDQLDRAWNTVRICMRKAPLNVSLNITERFWKGLSKMNLSGLNIMPEAELRKLLYEFNDTEATYPEDVTLQQLFEIQARRARERIALVSGNKTLTYERLNEEANGWLAFT